MNYCCKICKRITISEICIEIAIQQQVCLPLLLSLDVTFLNILQKTSSILTHTHTVKFLCIVARYLVSITFEIL